MIEIIAKKDSKMEQTFKEMYEQLQENQKTAIQLVKEVTGVEPESIGYRWGWGEIVTFLCTLIRFKKEDWDKIDPKILRRDKRDDNYFKPSLRYTAGKKFRERFRNEVTNKGLTEEPLIKIGIHTQHDSRCSWCQPTYDEKNNRYILSCSDSLPHGFDKNIDKTQFEIEY